MTRSFGGSRILNNNSNHLDDDPNTREENFFLDSGFSNATDFYNQQTNNGTDFGLSEFNSLIASAGGSEAQKTALTSKFNEVTSTASDGGGNVTEQEFQVLLMAIENHLGEDVFAYTGTQNDNEEGRAITRRLRWGKSSADTVLNAREFISGKDANDKPVPEHLKPQNLDQWYQRLSIPDPNKANWRVIDAATIAALKPELIDQGEWDAAVALVGKINSREKLGQLLDLIEVRTGNNFNDGVDKADEEEGSPYSVYTPEDLNGDSIVEEFSTNDTLIRDMNTNNVFDQTHAIVSTNFTSAEDAFKEIAKANGSDNVIDGKDKDLLVSFLMGNNRNPGITQEFIEEVIEQLTSSNGTIDLKGYKDITEVLKRAGADKDVTISDIPDLISQVTKGSDKKAEGTPTNTASKTAGNANNAPASENRTDFDELTDGSHDTALISRVREYLTELGFTEDKVNEAIKNNNTTDDFNGKKKLNRINFAEFEKMLEELEKS